MAGEEGAGALGSTGAIVGVAVAGVVLAVLGAVAVTTALDKAPESGSDTSVVDYGDTQQ